MGDLAGTRLGWTTATPHQLRRALRPARPHRIETYSAVNPNSSATSLPRIRASLSDTTAVAHPDVVAGVAEHDDTRRNSDDSGRSSSGGASSTLRSYPKTIELNGFLRHVVNALPGHTLLLCQLPEP